MIDPAPALDALAFDRDGLVAAIAQQHDTGEVLMMAWMNREPSKRLCAVGRSVTTHARARSCGGKVRPRAKPRSWLSS